MSESSHARPALELIILPEAYELWLDGQLLTRLPGGAAALLAGAGAQLKEIHIEAAIERAEEWLMPHSPAMQGLMLLVRDAAGGWPGKPAGDWSVQDLEQAFNRVHDAVAYGRPTERDGVAHTVLLRELAHHGRLAGVRFGSPAAEPPEAPAA